MSRKHYEAIAAIIRARTGDATHDPGYALSMITDQLALYFAADNSRFDRSRFLEACDLYPSTR